MKSLVGGDVEIPLRLVDPFERVAERRREVLFVSEQYVNLLDELRLVSAAASGPPLAVHSDGR